MHEKWMQLALNAAKEAELSGEVPIGAVITLDNELIATGHNLCITNSDPSAHAEVVALRAAGSFLKNYRLLGATLYVTLEPCIMCVGAMIHARIANCVFGAFDPKTGAAGSVIDGFNQPMHNHKVTSIGGILASECGSLLQNFFSRKRNSR